jgi:hypothetical protein
MQPALAAQLLAAAYLGDTSAEITERAHDMTNRTLERARKTAQKIMEDLQGEGMLTLRELKVLLEREIRNRLGVSDPSERGSPAPQERTGPVSAKVERPARTEAMR